MSVSQSDPKDPADSLLYLLSGKFSSKPEKPRFPFLYTEKVVVIVVHR